MKNKFLLLILLTFTFSCNENPKENVKNSDAKTDTTRLPEKYNMALSFDTIQKICYTIDFENMLFSDYQILSNFIINDIYKHNSEYFIKIESFITLQDFYFELKISESELKKIREEMPDYGFITESVLVMKIDTINKIDFILESTEDDFSIDLGTNGFGSFLCKGKVIEFIKN